MHRKVIKVKEIKESYTKCARSVQAAKLVSLKDFKIYIHVYIFFGERGLQGFFELCGTL